MSRANAVIMNPPAGSYVSPPLGRFSAATSLADRDRQTNGTSGIDGGALCTANLAFASGDHICSRLDDQAAPAESMSPRNSLLVGLGTVL